MDATSCILICDIQNFRSVLEPWNVETKNSFFLGFLSFVGRKFSLDFRNFELIVQSEQLYLLQVRE